MNPIEFKTVVTAAIKRGWIKPTSKPMTEREINAWQRLHSKQSRRQQRKTLNELYESNPTHKSQIEG